MEILRRKDLLDIRSTQSNDITPYMAEHEQCPPGHFWGPGVRDYYLVHYIKSGVGVFRSGGREYSLGEGQLFFIFPESISYYCADKNDPWFYYWIGFGGSGVPKYLSAAGITPANPVFTDSKQHIFKWIQDMEQHNNGNPADHLRFRADMFNFMACLVEDGKSDTEETGAQTQYFYRAADYISRNYSQPLSVISIAKMIGIDRKYLYQLFIKHSKMSPKEFILQCRMDKACELMGNSQLSIGDISRSVGYSDPLMFSRMFKKTMGAPPSQYRNAKTKKAPETSFSGGCSEHF